MPASELAYPSRDPEGHLATRDTVEINGKIVPRAEKEQLGRVAQLSEFAHGEGSEEEKSFIESQPKVENPHDFGPDN